MIGTTLDKYEILQKVGEGGMATVYRGRHVTLDREVAIKVLHPHLSSSTRNRKRFAREARAIEHLKHDNILEIFDYSGTTSSDCYIVTEFVRGETLNELLHRCQRAPSEVAALIGIGLCGALAYAHTAGVLHRDIKPDNVMIRLDGRVKLMDFGIARFLDESQVTLTGALVGSPAYMSPEQAREADLDGRSDLFSLGTVLFHLVTGTMPFSGSHPGVVLKNIIEGIRPHIIELWPAASASLADVIERLLAVHREDRFADAATTAAALRSTLDEVELDPADPRWSLSRFVQDPAAYEAELDAHLRGALIRSARASMERGDSLVGLRLVNRLLSMEDGHPEALELLQQFHGLDGDKVPKRSAIPWALAAAALVATLPFAWMWSRDLGADAVSVAPVPAATMAAVQAPGPQARTTVSEIAPAPALVPAPDAAPPTEPDLPQPEVAADPQLARPPAVADRTATISGGASGGPGVDARLPRGDAPTPRPPAEQNPGADLTRGGAAAPSASASPACLAFRSRSAPADVFLDGVCFASTRDVGCREIAAGTYTFVLRASLFEDASVEVTLAPGERRDRQLVDMRRLPARVRFPNELSASCTATVDDVLRGTLGDLRFTLQLDRPELEHNVVVNCGSRKLSHRYRGLAYPEVWFEAEGEP